MKLARIKELLFGHYSVMLVATTVANVINYFFAIAAGRLLGPSTYSALVSLVAISMVLTVGATTFQIVIARYVSNDTGRGEEGNAKYFTWKALTFMCIAGLVGTVVMLCLSYPISIWLKIGTLMPCILLALRLGLSIVNPLPMGVLQGLQEFNWLGLTAVAGAAARFVVGISLVALGLGLNGAMLGEICGVIVVIVLPFLFVGKWLKGRPRTGVIDRSHIMRFAPASLVMVISTTAFIAVDVVLVRAFLPTMIAGYYVGAQRMSTIVYFLPGAVAGVMFPKVTERCAALQPAWGILLRSLAIVTALCGFAAALFSLFPRQFLGLLFGSKYLPGSTAVPLLSWAMFCFSLTSVMATFLLGTDRVRFMYVLGAGVFLEAVMIVLFHGGIMQVAWIVFTLGLGLMTAMGVYLLLLWRFDAARSKADDTEYSPAEILAEESGLEK